VAVSAAVGVGVVALVGLPEPTGSESYPVSVASPQPVGHGSLEVVPVQPSSDVVPEPPVAERERRGADETARREPQSAAGRAAFVELRQRIEQAGHLPLKADVNLESQLEQPIQICALGDAEVEVALPPLPPVALLPGKSPWQLECQGPTGGAWSIAANPVGKGGPSIEIARVEARQGELVLTLAAMPAVNDPLWLAAREALTTAPLLVRLAGEDSAAFETFVQFCTPRRLDPIVLERLLTDDAWLATAATDSPTPRRGAETPPLPGTPWALDVELAATGPRGISGAVTKSADARLTASRVPVAVRVEWTWSGMPMEPFMETTLALQEKPRAPGLGSGEVLTVQLTESRVTPSWRHWKRLGSLGDSRVDFKAKPSAVRGEAPMIAQMPESPSEVFSLILPGDVPEARYSSAAMAACAEIARQYVPGWNAQALGEVLTDAAKARELPLNEWKKLIRQQLKRSENYRTWVFRVAPPAEGAKPVGRGDELKAAEWQQRNHMHQVFLEAGPQEADRYWDDLKFEPGRHEAEALEVSLCCLHFELAPVLAEKRTTKKLLDAVGEGTVELTGRIWAAPNGNGPSRVLVAEFTSIAGVAQP
jgi:hypothetical protein